MSSILSSTCRHQTTLNQWNKWWIYVSWSLCTDEILAVVQSWAGYCEVSNVACHRSPLSPCPRPISGQLTPPRSPAHLVLVCPDPGQSLELRQLLPHLNLQMNADELVPDWSLEKCEWYLDLHLHYNSAPITHYTLHVITAVTLDIRAGNEPSRRI